MQSVIGGVVGAITSLISMNEERHQAKEQNKLANRQLDLQNQEAERQDQALNAANQKQADVDALLSANTVTNPQTALTSGSSGQAQDKNLLSSNTLLGE